MAIEIVKIVNKNIISPLVMFWALMRDIKLLPKNKNMGTKSGFLALKSFFLTKNINIQAKNAMIVNI